MTDKIKPDGYLFEDWREQLQQSGDTCLCEEAGQYGGKTIPVYLVTESQMRRMEALEGIAKLVQETNIGRPTILEMVYALPPKEPKE